MLQSLVIIGNKLLKEAWLTFLTANQNKLLSPDVKHGVVEVIAWTYFAVTELNMKSSVLESNVRPSVR